MLGFNLRGEFVLHIVVLANYYYYYFNHPTAYLKTCVFKPETNPTTKLGLIFAVRHS